MSENAITFVGLDVRPDVADQEAIVEVLEESITEQPVVRGRERVQLAR